MITHTTHEAGHDAGSGLGIAAGKTRFEQVRNVVPLDMEHLDYEMWTGPAPLRPYDGLPHKRWWP